jgi:probable H4MPT-linked C1 transfer pathway protein
VNHSLSIPLEDTSFKALGISATGSAIGWDIGGAHLKAVKINATGGLLAAKQLYCPLWRGLHELNQAIDTILSEFNADTHFVTMTGELADIFQNRDVGVIQLANCVTQKLSGKVMFYAGKAGFVMPTEVDVQTANIASMNWLASVEYAAQHIPQALFLDIGSTTTDIAVIRDATPQVLGFNDATRMQTDELVYTGVVRTPLMALAQKILFAGNMVNVAAEHFATTADVYTLTGDLPKSANMAETADGMEKTIEASARRIARMIGWDAGDAPLSAWQNLACAFKDAQLHQIKLAVLRQLALLDNPQELCLVGAGAGDFLVAELAAQLGFKYQSIASFINADNDQIKAMATVCLPAYAVASLGSTAHLC